MDSEIFWKYWIICCGGWTLNQAQANYPISNLEALAVVRAINDLDCNLKYAKFTVVTEHQPLNDMLKNPRVPPGKNKLLFYDFDVENVKGSVNRVVDALCRVHHSDNCDWEWPWIISLLYGSSDYEFFSLPCCEQYLHSLWTYKSIQILDNFPGPSLNYLWNCIKLHNTRLETSWPH